MASLPKPDLAPTYKRLELHDIFNIAQWQDQVPWRPFRKGVEIHRLSGDGITGPSTALLRFRRGSKIPLHLHAGCEHILVLAGSERDQNGPIKAGTLIINPPDTQHSVVSENGCIVLAIYEKPVTFKKGRKLKTEG